jgi:hypothetical protein
MNPTLQTMLIAVAFVSQLLVMSFVVPRSFRRSFAELLRRCPPERYPSLYPLAVKRMQRLNRSLNIVNVAAAAAGAIALLWGLWQRIPPGELAIRLIWTSVGQTIPAMLRLPWQIRMMRAYRDLPAPPQRSAELRAMHITDFVPPALIASGLCITILAVAGALLLLYRGAAPGVQQPIVMLVIMVGMGMLILIRMLYVVLSGAPLPRPDPYMSTDDLFRARRVRFRMLFGGATALGLYFSGLQAYVALNAPFPMLYLYVAISLLMQLLFLRSARYARRTLAMRDLEVYSALRLGS